jgi:hypothetical protein
MVDNLVVALIPNGIPRPLSSIIIELSFFNVNFITSALPDMTSSTELSKTSQTK